MSADLLREAAALMREHAEAATPGPWTQVTHPHFGLQAAVRTPDGDLQVSARTEPYRGADTATHIASWHPDVALAVADSIEEVLVWFDPEDCTEAERGMHDALLAVARAYLATP